MATRNPRSVMSLRERFRDPDPTVDTRKLNESRRVCIFPAFHAPVAPSISLVLYLYADVDIAPGPWTPGPLDPWMMSPLPAADFATAQVVID